MANISALFKKGSKEDPLNYRSVSLTVQACKIFESIVRDAVMKLFEKFNLIFCSQHGFTNKWSCLTNLMELMEYGILM